MRQALLALALCAAPAAALADDLSYSYVDGRYFSSDSDAVSANQQGGLLAASYELVPGFFVAADGSYSKSDKLTATSGTFETKSIALRVGAHHALTPVLDLVGSAGGVFADVQGKGAANGQDDNDFGYLAELGLRLAVAPQFEVGASYGYQSIFSVDQSLFTGDLQYHFYENFSLVGSATYAKRTDLYSVGIRYHF